MFIVRTWRWLLFQRIVYADGRRGRHDVQFTRFRFPMDAVGWMAQFGIDAAKTRCMMQLQLLLSAVLNLLHCRGSCLRISDGSRQTAIARWAVLSQVAKVKGHREDRQTKAGDAIWKTVKRQPYWCSSDVLCLQFTWRWPSNKQIICMWQITQISMELLLT